MYGNYGVRFWLLANSFLYGLQWLIYLGGEKGWLIHLQGGLLRNPSPNSRRIDCIFFVFCIKVSRFLPENMLK
ncbi:hypothetical protein [Enterococcus faecalis]|uniref:hypothetical protein n=1 Tax=Enterococcus faecalis TaxID=1351 RepID=UPI003BA39D08